MYCSPWKTSTFMICKKHTLNITIMQNIAWFSHTHSKPAHYGQPTIVLFHNRGQEQLNLTLQKSEGKKDGLEPKTRQKCDNISIQVAF